MKKRTIDKIIVTLISIAIIIFIGLISFAINFHTEETYKDIKVVIEEIKYESEPIQYVVEEINYEEVRINQFYNELKRIDEIKKSSNEEWFIAYKKLISDYQDVITEDSIYDSLSEQDIEYLQRMVETECHGADFDSKTHVAAVALSRVVSERFPNTLTEVITKPNQFCYGRKNIDESTVLACEYAYQIGTEVDGCLFFHSGKWKEKFNKADYVLTDNVGHHFYR